MLSLLPPLFSTRAQRDAALGRRGALLAIMAAFACGLACPASAQTGSKVHDHAPNAPASGAFALIIAAVAGSALGRSGAPYALTILHQAFDAAGGWKLSSTGPTTAAVIRSQGGNPC